MDFTLPLSPAMAKDLRCAVTVHGSTVGTYDYPRGRPVRLRTGRALQRRGLVELANALSANRHPLWRPTTYGLAYVATNFALGE